MLILSIDPFCRPVLSIIEGSMPQLRGSNNGFAIKPRNNGMAAMIKTIKALWFSGEGKVHFELPVSNIL
jgi:hypothetical protein